MDDRNALTIVPALGEAAFKAALRAIAMLLISLAVLAVLAGAAYISSAIEAAQPELAQPVQGNQPDYSQPEEPTQDILLLPAREPGTGM